MKKIIGIIALLVIGFFAYRYYRSHTLSIPKDPSGAYATLMQLPLVDQFKGFQKLLTSWNHDPASIIPYPSGWRKVAVTIGKDTFDVITPDTANPPVYYVSTAFPKKLIKKVTVAHCLNLDPKKITDWCVVGDNEQVNAYFKLITWAKEYSSVNGQNLLGGITPQMNIQIPNTQ